MNEQALVEAIRQIVREELQPVNDRLEKLEQGQQKLEQGQRELEQGQRKLEQGQQEIKDFIVQNNVAIGEVLTEALEAQHTSKDALYKIIPFEK